jgi:transposase
VRDCTTRESATETHSFVNQAAYRCQIGARLGDCRNQLEHLKDRQLRKMIEQQRVKFELKAIDKNLAALVAQHEDWHVLGEMLCSVLGVGAVLAQTLIALLPELGRLSRRAIAGLVGVAPYDDDSGSHSDAGHIKGGRATVRKVLHTAKLTAMRRNPAIEAFAKRSAGKRNKVIIVARMRKLLVILNAMLPNGIRWRVDSV